MGYRSSIITEVSVTSSKEVFVEIPMDENIQDLAEVLVKPEIKKDRTVNPMAITGGRMISIEEASRFANGFDDPARLSSAFAGVAGDVGTNAVAIGETLHNLPNGDWRELKYLILPILPIYQVWAEDSCLA